ncbi:MAG: methylmalonyl Co-A mutase-associated GTPase MeaB [Acidiferrobacterales bacterium]|nr:methylmalonyl Co-A mutase-associated GTPase MeaB [Acidiferrobacterales bacterium]
MSVIDLDRLRAADPRALGRAITLIESSKSAHRDQAEELLSAIMEETGHSLRIGITGVPGVGKSTFIEAFGNHMIEQGHKVAVLTIDPSSSINGGSILGDKTRMPTLAIHPSAFIRPSPSGATLGGVARRTREAILLCEAAGFDIVIVETVGVGQSETLVSEMTDLFLLMLLPGGGDDLQGIKRGIMELADIVVINKADGDLQRAAKVSASDVQHALQLLKQKFTRWRVPVLSVSALHNESVDQVWDQVCRYQRLMQSDDLFDTRRQNQSIDWMWREAGEIVMQTLRSSDQFAEECDQLQQQVKAGKLAPTVAAGRLVARLVNVDSDN